MKTSLILNISSVFLISILFVEFLFAEYTKCETEYVLANGSVSPNNHVGYFQKKTNLVYISFEKTSELIEHYQNQEIQHIVNKIYFNSIYALCNNSGEKSKRPKTNTNDIQTLNEKAKTTINKVIIGHSISGMLTY